MNFVAIDVETANPDQSSICSVGIAVFRDGEIVEEQHLLVDPQDEFSNHHIRIHGVTPERIAGAPSVPEMLADIGGKYGAETIVHHGHFDRTAFRRAFVKHGHAPWSCRWLDSAMVARRTWLEHDGAGGYGLKFLARHLGIPLAQHHDPLQDARAAGLLLLRAIAETGCTLNDWHVRVVQPIGRQASERRQDAQVLAEVLQNKIIVFTGKLSVERQEAEALAKNAGFRVGDNVTRETSILVVGDQDVRRLAGKKVSSKQVKAEKYAEAGQSIRIVTESDFRDLIAQG